MRRVALVCAAVGCTAQTATPAAWTYENPGSWGTNYEECKSNLQSPIDIRSGEAAPAAPAFFKIWSPRLRSRDPLPVRNTGKSLTVDMTGRGISATTELLWDRMVLTEMRWHVPAEHLIDGVRYPLERQAEFIPAQLASLCPGADCPPRHPRMIISHLYELDHTHPDRMLEQLLGGSDRVVVSGGSPASTISPTTQAAGSAVSTPTTLSKDLQTGQSVDIDVAAEFDSITNGKYYAYPGSETTPPCAETVTWFVSAEPKTVSHTQLDTLAHITSFMTGSHESGAPLPMPVYKFATEGRNPKGTARPLQRVNGRPLAIRKFYSS
eukprot:TRINITY_DN6099_c1_g1_i1.p1 TRINITY_DN6099_c1_g1~~TRINITY_DN6099_c1_g1_i1.p1  ORF type:complete len:341 (+),score=26.64 TRINITY_DN6099_c1_g1_i1:55-1023(+)